MVVAKSEVDKNLATLVEMADAVLQGQYDRVDLDLDAEGMLATLAQKINSMVVNLRHVEAPLVNAEEQAPAIMTYAHNVVELMAQATDEVLAKSDRAITLLEGLEPRLAPETSAGAGRSGPDVVVAIKAALFDIIASQSYQDVARQKLEALIRDLNQVRDWLIEVLIVLNLRKDASVGGKVKETAERLRKASGSSAPESLKQDLVDDLLAEFGF